MSEKIVHVTDGSFEQEVINASKNGPVLVDYWAAWCAPCKLIDPLLHDVADDYDGKITVAKLDIESNRDTPLKYGIRGIPTLMIFKDGVVEATKVGVVSKSQLAGFIDDSI